MARNRSADDRVIPHRTIPWPATAQSPTDRRRMGPHHQPHRCRRPPAHRCGARRLTRHRRASRFLVPGRVAGRRHDNHSRPLPGQRKSRSPDRLPGLFGAHRNADHRPAGSCRTRPRFTQRDAQPRRRHSRRSVCRAPLVVRRRHDRSFSARRQRHRVCDPTQSPARRLQLLPIAERRSHKNNHLRGAHSTPRLRDVVDLRPWRSPSLGLLDATGGDVEPPDAATPTRVSSRASWARYTRAVRRWPERFVGRLGRPRGRFELRVATRSAQRRWPDPGLAVVLWCGRRAHGPGPDRGERNPVGYVSDGHLGRPPRWLQLRRLASEGHTGGRRA